ncbi:hypothetical protein SASPL_135003 [Salvia splendens]|uniref:Beta-glucosidase n=1 Tax=Salvia splendens TaxID=180675 RepID=A0A8X8WXC6_SALSN|nr:hypothetical protein SASPL_135003 [Salvia splendens]
MALQCVLVFMFLVCLLCKEVVLVSSHSIHCSNLNSKQPLHQVCFFLLLYYSRFLLFIYGKFVSQISDRDVDNRDKTLDSWSILNQETAGFNHLFYDKILQFSIIYNAGYNNWSKSNLNRSSLPPDFIFGAASSAYQYEGAAFEGGKGKSIWDTYSHTPGKISDGSNGDVATNFYNLYKDDVKLMKVLGIDAFRMSISWPRILPRGKLSEGVNKEGVAFYNNVFNELIANGITPFVTLFHWDVPQALEDEYGGFLSPLIIDDFRDFAEVCFKEFGDRIKHWMTVNEAYIFAVTGYDGGLYGPLAPGRCSSCPRGDSAIEPYIVAHHLLLSHATTFKLYKHKYQATQTGEIGITLVSNWIVPYSSTDLDIKAAQRALDFMYGWFMNPIVYGDYPAIMRSIVKNRLPKFTEEESLMLKGSFDFIGLNYYTANYAAHVSTPNPNISCSTDNMVHLSSDIDGVPIGDPTAVGVFYVYPQGLHDILLYTKQKYNISKTIYVTETGDFYNSSTEDQQRIDFYYGHIRAVQQAIE